jgi:hypothetical protein
MKASPHGNPEDGTQGGAPHVPPDQAPPRAAQLVN